MSKLVPPHGGKGLVCCLLEGAALEEELKKAAGLKQIEISSRAKGDLIMMGHRWLLSPERLHEQGRLEERVRKDAAVRRYLLARAGDPGRVR